MPSSRRGASASSRPPEPSRAIGLAGQFAAPARCVDARFVRRTVRLTHVYPIKNKASSNGEKSAVKFRSSVAGRAGDSSPILVCYGYTRCPSREMT